MKVICWAGGQGMCQEVDCNGWWTIKKSAKIATAVMTIILTYFVCWLAEGGEMRYEFRMPSTPSAAYLCQEEIARQPIGVSVGVCAAAVGVCAAVCRVCSRGESCRQLQQLRATQLHRCRDCHWDGSAARDPTNTSTTEENQVDKHRIAILGILQAFRHLIPLVLVVGDRLRGVIRGATSCSVVSADHHYWRSLWTMSLHYPSILHSISKWAWLSIRNPWSALTHSFMCYQWYPKISNREKKRQTSDLKQSWVIWELLVWHFKFYFAEQIWVTWLGQWRMGTWSRWRSWWRAR